MEGKVVIVTGGGRGIGRDTSRVLARHGAKVVVVYAAGKERAEETVAEIEAEGGTATALPADVRDAQSVQSLIDKTVAAYGRVDGIVNNAIAGLQDGRFEEVTDADYLNSFQYGCQAVVNTVRSVRPVMAAQGGGRIVNIVTELWNMAPAGWSVYLAGKGAMVGLSRSLAVELGPENITVNMVAPGWMATDKVDTSSEGSQNFAKSLPLKRHGSGEEIGKACVFFLSDLSSYVTGVYMPVTGGRVTQMGA